MHGWAELRKRYRRNGIALGLGAGVSSSSGIPNWPTLLKRIAGAAEGATGEALVKALHEQCGYSLPVVAGIVESMFAPEERFSDKIRDSLYGDDTFGFYRASKKEAARRLVQHVITHNKTLAAVGAFCARRAVDRHAFVPNPRIRAIINTNFDALLTAYTKARYGSRLIRTIDRPSATPSPRRINSYHIHGFLQFWREDIDDPAREAPDVRVLTEHEFFDFFDRPNSAFNAATLHILREHAVLFVGASLQDDNLRRLLHYSRQERTESYLREGVPRKEAEERSVRHYAFQESRSAALDGAVQRSLERLGVSVILFKAHDEIPSHLGDLYDDESYRWADVYQP